MSLAAMTNAFSRIATSPALLQIKIFFSSVIVPKAIVLGYSVLPTIKRLLSVKGVMNACSMLLLVTTVMCALWLFVSAWFIRPESAERWAFLSVANATDELTRVNGLLAHPCSYLPEFEKEADDFNERCKQKEGYHMRGSGVWGGMTAVLSKSLSYVSNFASPKDLINSDLSKLNAANRNVQACRIMHERMRLDNEECRKNGTFWKDMTIERENAVKSAVCGFRLACSIDEVRCHNPYYTKEFSPRVSKAVKEAQEKNTFADCVEWLVNDPRYVEAWEMFEIYQVAANRKRNVVHDEM